MENKQYSTEGFVDGQPVDFAYASYKLNSEGYIDFSVEPPTEIVVDVSDIISASYCIEIDTDIDVRFHHMLKITARFMGRVENYGVFLKTVSL